MRSTYFLDYKLKITKSIDASPCRGAERKARKLWA